MQIKTNQDVGVALAEIIEGAVIQTTALDAILGIASARWGTERPSPADASEAGEAYCDAREFNNPDTRKSRKSDAVALMKAHTWLAPAAEKVRADKRFNNQLGIPEMTKLSRKLNAAKGNIDEAVEKYFYKAPSKTKTLSDEIQAITDRLAKLSTRKGTKNQKAVDAALKALEEHAGFTPNS